MNQHLNGGGLHRSVQGSIPYCGTDSETGMRVAKLVPKDRTTGETKRLHTECLVKAFPVNSGRAETAHHPSIQ